MIIKRRISKRIEKKTNYQLRELIIFLKKQKSEFWVRAAQLLARPRKKKIIVNFERLNDITNSNDIILIPGKLLAFGNLKHPLTISCYSCSSAAKSQKNAKITSIENLFKINPSGKGIKLII